MTRKALGKGLSALLGEVRQPEEKVIEVDIDLIDPNNQQPRSRFNDERLKELADSIRVNGIVQPLVARRRGLRYQIVTGERRWRAAKKAGLTRIPVVLREVPDDKMLELSLTENIQREDLNPIEQAQAYQKLIDALGLTQEEVARKVGKDRTSVANYLRLLKLPQEVRRLVEEEKLSMGHARALLGLDSPEAQRQLALEILSRELSVRETERTVQRLLSATAAPTDKARRRMAANDPNIRAAEERLSRKLGTKVRIIPAGNRGKIEIEYYTDSDLERIYNLIMHIGD